MFYSIIFSFFSLLPVLPIPQDNLVLMSINGRQITRSEFEYRMNLDHVEKAKGKTFKTYLDKYIQDQLKVSAALEAGIDTMPSFRNKMIKYHKELVRSYMINNQTEEEEARNRYDQMKSQIGHNELCIVQIYKHLRQNARSSEIEATKRQMDSIYSALLVKPELFNDFISRYSERKDSVWIAQLDCPEDVERVVFALSDNKFSSPFETSDGIHIYKLIKRRSLAPFDNLQSTILRQFEVEGEDNEVSTAISKLKGELKYSLNDEAVNELRQNGTTDKTLFTIGDKPYKVNDFNRFAKSHPMELDIQIDKFINKCILDYQSKKLASEHPEMSMRLKVYRDEKLVEEENKINSYEHIDSLALKDYFNQNRSKYEWDSPRFDGALIYSIDKKSGKKARKLLKKASRDQWNSLIAAEFNKTEERVRIQQGLFAIGDNPAIDGLVFDRTNNVVPLEGYKYITTVGKKKKVPDNYKDVIDKLSTDYRNYLQQEWAEHLRAVAKVEISEEVLKTVNNH